MYKMIEWQKMNGILLRSRLYLAPKNVHYNQPQLFLSLDHWVSTEQNTLSIYKWSILMATSSKSVIWQQVF